MRHPTAQARVLGFIGCASAKHPKLRCTSMIYLNYFTLACWLENSVREGNVPGSKTSACSRWLGWKDGELQCQQQLRPAAPAPGSTKLFHNQFLFFKIVAQSSHESSLKLARFGFVLHSSELIYLRMGWSRKQGVRIAFPFSLSY